MQNRSSKRRLRDPNRLAASIVEKATQEPPAEEISEEPQEPVQGGKNPAAVALGRLGGKKGGRARAEKLTAEQRTDIARKAAQARWSRRDST
ncbi:MAG: hypothetical protein ACE5KO_05730 [Candidatus Bathyarchaeia archaeon]